MSQKSNPSLSAAQARDLRAIAATMVPASVEYGVPGADDPIIFADITGSVGPDIGALRDALRIVSELSAGAFCDLNATARAGVAEAIQARGGAPQAVLSRVILQCYYRDDRVLSALGLEARAPFPNGRELEQGDWSLLDAVRNRPRMWRDVH